MFTLLFGVKCMTLRSKSKLNNLWSLNSKSIRINIFVKTIKYGSIYMKYINNVLIIVLFTFNFSFSQGWDEPLKIFGYFQNEFEYQRHFTNNRAVR